MLTVTVEQTLKLLSLWRSYYCERGIGFILYVTLRVLFNLALQWKRVSVIFSESRFLQ
jgi:hypothetical protein